MSTRAQRVCSAPHGLARALRIGALERVRSKLARLRHAQKHAAPHSVVDLDGVHQVNPLNHLQI